MQDVAIICIVTIQAPAVGLVVLEDDVRVHPGELTPAAIGGHARMTVGTRENALREWRWGHLKVFRRTCDNRGLGAVGRQKNQPAQRQNDAANQTTHNATPPCVGSRAATWPGRAANGGR